MERRSEANQILQMNHIKNPHLAARVFLYGAPGEIRTPDQVVRSHLLYPAELRVRKLVVIFNVIFAIANSSPLPAEIDSPHPVARASPTVAALTAMDGGTAGFARAKSCPRPNRFRRFFELPTKWFEATYSPRVARARPPITD